jgi:hypothetical protein
MRTHILMTVMALIMGACASKEHQSQAKFDRQQAQEEEFTRNHFDAGNRFR